MRNELIRLPYLPCLLFVLIHLTLSTSFLPRACKPKRLPCYGTLGTRFSRANESPYRGSYFNGFLDRERKGDDYTVVGVGVRHTHEAGHKLEQKEGGGGGRRIYYLAITVWLTDWPFGRGFEWLR